ncbi:PH domain-containing protein [Streptomyces litchfieldiae]|uniref:PH domain-containing protein n=1 Tax=Streptomyces litchfieldiae TaxID=3075543 RepID=A0ABU2MMD7_9ACTN|nr:PH domain-containing protein [Streptomyces sp. DSM 44938]MDT0342284.1 PH domain-containing protein [Streptomyces sp. DSM 44938]
MSEPQKYADRVYRSGSALAGGVLLLGLAGWLGGDAIVRGEGRAPVTAVFALLFVAPLVIAFTLRPAVFASDERLRVRNPFRTITLPWTAVEGIRASYSSEVLAGGTKYQMWAIPVSLRQRSRATRHNEELASGKAPRGGLLGFGGGGLAASQQPGGERTAPGDVAVAELRELAERHGEGEPPEGAVTVRWSYEILAPLAVGAVALIILWLTR